MIISVNGKNTATSAIIIAPKQLINKLDSEICLAVRFAPSEERIAAEQAPTLKPNTTNTAWSREVITPAEASAIKIPTEADELWIIPVKIIPTNSPSSGKLSLSAILRKASLSPIHFRFSLISERPRKSIPKPAAICP